MKASLTQLQERYKLIIVWLPVNYWKAWSECCDDDLMAVPVVRPGRGRVHVTMLQRPAQAIPGIHYCDDSGGGGVVLSCYARDSPARPV